MTKLFTQNKKMAKSTDKANLVFNFGIVAYESKTGFKTCPMAGECKVGCYAQAGAYIWSNVSQAFEKRLEITLSTEFIDLATKELFKLLARAERQKKQLIIRVHDSGDFYNIDYLKKWIGIMVRFPMVKFYAYTKMVPMFNLYKKANDLPQNFRIIYSEGGLADKLIDTTTDYHARVFSSIEDLDKAGYSNAMENDLVAGLGDNNKIGLVFHGAKSKAWATDKTNNIAKGA